MSFNTWLDTFISEKNINLDEAFEVEGPNYGTNYMVIENVVDVIKETSSHEQSEIKNQLIKLDSYNQPIEPFLKHLAQAIAL